MNFRRKLKQYAVYWPPSRSNNLGQEVYGEPVEIRVRWEDNSQEMVDKTGQYWVSKTQVYHTHETEEGGFLWKGRFSGLTNTADPTANANAARVLSVESIPSRTADQTLRRAYL